MSAKTSFLRGSHSQVGARTRTTQPFSQVTRLNEEGMDRGQWRDVGTTWQGDLETGLWGCEEETVSVSRVAVGTAPGAPRKLRSRGTGLESIPYYPPPSSPPPFVHSA